MLTIQQFCDKHCACNEGRKWALANCSSMQEAWDKCENPDWLIWIATRKDVLDDKSLRLFAVWCCRQVQHLMKDSRSIAAVDAAEQFANGLITAKQLALARNTADAAYAAADAAYAAADADAADAAYAAYAAAAYAAYAAADAAYAAADAACKTAKQAQANYLRQNCKPNFI